MGPAAAPNPEKVRILLVLSQPSGSWGLLVGRALGGREKDKKEEEEVRGLGQVS